MQGASLPASQEICSMLLGTATGILIGNIYFLINLVAVTFELLKAAFLKLLLLVAPPFSVIYFCAPSPLCRRCYLREKSYFITTLLVYILYSNIRGSAVG